MTGRQKLLAMPHNHLLICCSFVLPYTSGPVLRPGRNDNLLSLRLYQLHPLVAPQVSHFSQVPLRTMVKFWHSVHMLPV